VTGILLALVASFAWGFGDYAGGVASRSLRMPVVLCVSQLAGFAVVVPVVLVSGSPTLQGSDALWAVASGLVAVGSLGLMFRAMAVGAVSIVGPVTACGVAIPVIVGLARGEQPHALQFVGIAAAVLGVVLASIERRPEGGGKRFVAGLRLALGSAVCIGLWFVIFDTAAAHDPYWASLIARSTTATVAAAAVLLWRRPAQPGAAPQRATRPIVLLVLASGLADAVAEITFAVSTTYGLISLVSVIASLYPAFMVGFAALWLRERLARHQLIGVAAALAGIALISAG
jgi:drug/metabolite transporter (DMT)-like permease